MPVDENGNPIPVQQPTQEQLEAQKLEDARSKEQVRIEEDNRNAEGTARAFERLQLESLAEQKQFHDRVMWAIYIGLGLLAVFSGSRLLKKMD